MVIIHNCLLRYRWRKGTGPDGCYQQRPGLNVAHGSVLCSTSGQPVCSRCWLAVRAPSCKPELGARLLGWSRHSRTADAINWIFCRSSAALRGWPLAYRSQLKLMYGDHHQQPQKDCRYNEPDPFLVVREPCMRMIGPVHGQPTFHAAPNPTPYHTSYGLMTEHRGGRPWRCAILPPSGQSDWCFRTGRWEPLAGLDAFARGSPIWPLPHLSRFMSTR